MNLSAPTSVTFLVSLVVAVVGILLFLGVLPTLAVAGFSLTAFWAMTIAFVILALGCLLKGV